MDVKYKTLHNGLGSSIEKLVYIIFVFCGTKLIDDESKLSRLGGAGCGKTYRET
jgi:hypothetical protein